MTGGLEAVGSALSNTSGYAVPLTLGLSLWFILLHHAQGVREQNEPGFLTHWLRDATLALPAVVVAIALAIALVDRLSKRDRSAKRSPLERAAVVAGVAIAASAAFAFGGLVHDRLFTSYGGPQLSLLGQLTRDFVLSVALAIPIAGIVSSFWAPEVATVDTFRRTRRRTVYALSTLALGAMLFAGGAVQAADTGPGSPCPAGATLKTFDVQSIDVDWQLNNFGDHDPLGKMYILSKDIPRLRAQEAAKHVSTGENGDDAMQPLVIRANEGDCVEITYTNNASGGAYGFHLDGLAFKAGSSGDALGTNARSDVPQGQTRMYRYYIPNDPAMEGAHLFRPGPGYRDAVSHNLFGSLVAEPPGSVYLSNNTGQPLDSGWEATIVPGNGQKAFREFLDDYHEIGNENYKIVDKNGSPLPTVDPLTEAYRPGSRAINGRSEPFYDRLQANPDEDANGYGSYAFGDPSTPLQRGYLGDPTKIRLVHSGSEMFHIMHLHGGADRWRWNPLADKTFDYQTTGLDKHPKTQISPSSRLDAQSIGPGESYNLEIEGGAGTDQQAAGDFLYHCHIAEHYIAGMWGFWRVFDTRQPTLAPLPDRPAPPSPVTSADLIGKTFNGTTLTPQNIDDWVKAQLPPQGVPTDREDASVWNYSVDRSNPDAPIYLGEPEFKDVNNVSPNEFTTQTDPNHPWSMPGDRFLASNPDRPIILFNPTNGRYAYPLLRPHIGHRPPFSSNGHSGAPWLGEGGGPDPNEVAAHPPTPSGANAYANRADALCPTKKDDGVTSTPVRHFNVVAINVPVQNSPQTVDRDGLLFVLAKNKQGVYDGTKKREPLAIRSNVQDCDAVTLTSEIPSAKAFNGFSKVNMHIHHVQFDPQASDGVISGMSFEQSVRPYKEADPQLTADVAAGDTVLHLSDVSKFVHACADGPSCGDHTWIGISLGTEKIEVRQIASIDTAANTVTLTAPLDDAHPTGDYAGTEYTQYRWYPDILLDNIFWHDHVDGIHGWGHGLVGQLVIEPEGSTYHDPQTGAVIDSGTQADIHATNPLIPGVVDGSFREQVLWTIGKNPSTDGTLNLKAAPWSERLAENPDPSLIFSSYTHGDPITPMPKAYPGDPLVFRNIDVNPTPDTFHVDGHRFWLEPRFFTSTKGGASVAQLNSTYHTGISERWTWVMQGGAGGALKEPGDYLYGNTMGRHLRQGAWGIIRVLRGQSADLQPLPGTTPPPPAAMPTPTGGRPPAADGPGNPCPAGAPTRTFDVTAVDVKTSGGNKGALAAFVPSSQAAAVENGSLPEPLVLHVAAGDCVAVNFSNHRTVRSSFHVDKLLRRIESSGIDVGYNPEQTVAPGGSRQYRFFADSAKIQSALISDWGGGPATIDPLTGTTNVETDPDLDGMYGAIVVAPAGASFTDPRTGSPTQVGSQIDVHLPDGSAYRDFTLMLADQDPEIGQSHMPYPTDVHGPVLINYKNAGLRDDTNPDAFLSNATNGGDPATPLLRAYVGDPMVVHAMGAPGSEQVHSFNLGGESFPTDPYIPNANQIETRAVAPWESVDAYVTGGAGGRGGFTGDMYYGDLRRPFVQAGMWGLQRILPQPTSCTDPTLPIVPLVCSAPVLAPVASVDPPSLAFGDQAVGSASATQAVTVTNTGNAPLSVSTLSIAGADFSVASTTCIGASVAPGSSCLVNVVFTPQALGARSSSLLITDNAGGSPHSVSLSGNGVPAPAPAVTLAPAGGLAFADRQVGTGQSASQLATVTNSGTGALNITGATVVGANGADFPITSNACVGSLAAGASCTIGVAFNPSATGLRTASLQVADNAADSPQSLPLSGTGLAAPAAVTYLAGNQAVEAKLDSNAPGLAEAFKTTAASSGSVTQLKVYVDTGSTASSLVAGLYANNAATSRPGALLTSGSLAAPVAGQFNTVTVPAASVTSGSTYWIAILAPSGTLKFRDRGAVGAANSVVSSQTTLTSMPATWSSGAAFTDGALSAWAAGTLSATPPPPPPPPPGTLSVLVGNGATEAKIDSNAAGMAEAFKTTAASSGSVTRLRAYVDAGSTASSVVVGLYSNSATGHPGTLLASGTIAAPVAGQNNEVNVSAAAVTAGQTYWIAVLGPSGTLKFRDRGAVGAGSSETSAQATLTSLPATWTTGASFSDGMLSAVGLG